MQKLIQEGIQVDLTVTSPPYDNLRTYEDTCTWNWETFTQIADNLKQITREGGVIVWVVNDAMIDGSETLTSFKQALYFKEIGLNIHDTMIYKKKGVQYPESVRYYQNFEYMFIISKGKPKSIHLLKDRKNKSVGDKICGSQRERDGTFSEKTSAKLGRRIRTNGVRFNIWEYGTGNGQSSKDETAFEHPAIFPEQLVIDHILSWSNEGDTILDCMMGSGTTGVASMKTNREFIGIEKVQKYYEIAEQRIKHEAQQTRLI